MRRATLNHVVVRHCITIFSLDILRHHTFYIFYRVISYWNSSGQTCRDILPAPIVVERDCTGAPPGSPMPVCNKILEIVSSVAQIRQHTVAVNPINCRQMTK